MVSLGRRRQVTWFAASVATVMVLTAASVFCASGAAAQAPARGVAPSGGGYVASPATVHSAQMTLDVPKLRCVAGKSATVTAGMFGTTRAGSSLSRWQLVVIASCHGRTASYRGVQSDRFGRSTVLRFQPGDQVRLLKPKASEYEIDDLSTHAAAGGGGGSASPGGAQPSLAAPVFFGVHVNGSVTRALHVHVLRTRVNGKALGSLAHHRQLQISNHRAVARPAGVHKNGAFTVTVARTS